MVDGADVAPATDGEKDVEVVCGDDVEVAEIDRDRDITRDLISAAAAILVEGGSNITPDIAHDASAFLKAWFKRKMPQLEMPRML